MTQSTVRKGECFYTLSKDFEIMSMSKDCFSDCCLKGFEEKDVIGKSLWDIAPKAKGTFFEEQLRKVLETKQTVYFDYVSTIKQDCYYVVVVYPFDSNLLVYYYNITSTFDALQLARKNIINLKSQIMNLKVLFIICNMT